MEKERSSPAGGQYLIPFGVWCAGLLLSFRPTLLSGFSLIQAGPIDSRLNNFVLEHSYRWLLRWPNHLDLFTPDLLPGTKGMFGFTDLMLSLAPFFWIWRIVGFDPETSYQLWSIAIPFL